MVQTRYVINLEHLELRVIYHCVISYYYTVCTYLYFQLQVSSKVRELKARMEEGNLETVQFEQYQVS